MPESFETWAGAKAWRPLLDSGPTVLLVSRDGRAGWQRVAARLTRARLVSSPQRLHVQPDEERGQRRPLRHGPVGGPHHHHALLAQGAAVLPRLDVRPARRDEPGHQDLDGK